ncbi:MAG: tetratricopeptide repeat protein [Verrucomicrobiae bacterium]|nr:tetratricopeptide repeat protein [Verrucomicrobiae bacterium]
MSHPNPSYQRARVFYEQKRYAEAEKYFHEALSVSPRDATMLYELAFSQYMQKGREKIALETIQRAIAIEPNESYHHALAALIFSVLGRSKESLQSAQRAVELEPDNRLSFVALASSYLSSENWKEAEKAAREALRLDPNSPSASSQLIHALRMQGKKEEAKLVIDQALAKDPERIPTRHNAGWAALQRGDVQEAKEHFGETLRLDPENQYGTGAREGFLQAMRAQSLLYRIHLKISFWAERFSQGQRTWLFIVLPIILIKLLPILSVNRWSLTVAGSLIGLYWLFFLWRHIAESMGNLILLKDPSVRRILSISEKRIAVLTGTGFLIGPILIGFGAWLSKDTLIVSGAWLFGLIIPLNFYSNSDSRIEKVFLAILSIFYLSIIFASLGGVFYRPNLGTTELIASIIPIFILPAIWSWVRLIFFRTRI